MMVDFGDPYVNGMESWIIQSSYDTDKVIAAFETAIAQGLHPESVEQDIYHQLGVNPENFTYYDKEKISRKVNEAWEARQGEY